MNNADGQSRLVSLPSMLMTYLTGSGPNPTTDTAITTTRNSSDAKDIDVDSIHARERPQPIAQSSFLTPTNPHTRNSLHHTPQSTAPPSPTKSMGSCMFPRLGDGEAVSAYASDDVSRDGLSREGSLMSLHGRSKKRTSRPKTSYNMCHPPPKTSARSKIHVRAKPLLQLHKVAVSSRPVPAFELLPSAIFSPSLSRAIAKVFRPRHGLCPADLAVVKADKYHQHEASPLDEDESRDVLALICKGRKADALSKEGKAKIFLDDGSEWEACSLPNGGYEFTSTDTHGLSTVARWVVKRPRARRSQSASELDSPRIELKKFNFSTISPSSRRHPIIANLSSTRLDINESYCIPDPVVSSAAVSSTEHPSRADSPVRPEPVETTVALHNLITATAIWVALREGWSPGYRYDDSAMNSPASKLSPSPTRACTDLTDGVDDHHGPQRSGSIARMIRNAGNLKRRSTASALTDGASEDVTTSRNSSIRSTTGPRRRPRAESTSTVIHHRTTWPRPDMRAMRRHTAAVTSTHASGVDGRDDMTEEEEHSSSGDSEATPSKRSSQPTPSALILTTPEMKHEQIVSSPRQDSVPGTPVRQKRESSATDMSMNPKKMGPTEKVKRKRDRIFKVLLCGMV